MRTKLAVVVLSIAAAMLSGCVNPGYYQQPAYYPVPQGQVVQSGTVQPAPPAVVYAPAPVYVAPYPYYSYPYYGGPSIRFGFGGGHRGHWRQHDTDLEDFLDSIPW